MTPDPEWPCAQCGANDRSGRLPERGLAGPSDRSAATAAVRKRRRQFSGTTHFTTYSQLSRKISETVTHPRFSRTSIGRPTLKSGDSGADVIVPWDTAAWATFSPQSPASWLSHPNNRAFRCMHLIDRQISHLNKWAADKRFRSSHQGSNGLVERLGMPFPRPALLGPEFLLPCAFVGQRRLLPCRTWHALPSCRHAAFAR
jgi:hypothetical protein